MDASVYKKREMLVLNLCKLNI